MKADISTQGLTSPGLDFIRELLATRHKRALESSSRSNNIRTDCENPGRLDLAGASSFLILADKFGVATKLKTT
jgi:hypothetical protein